MDQSRQRELTFPLFKQQVRGNYASYIKGVFLTETNTSPPGEAEEGKTAQWGLETQGRRTGTRHRTQERRLAGPGAESAGTVAGAGGGVRP